MLAKSAVFFFAFVALVNAAPIVDSNTNLGVGPVDVWNPIEFGPGPVQIQPVQDTPSKRETSLNLDTDPVDVHVGPGGISVTGTLPHYRRGTSLNLDTDPVDVGIKIVKKAGVEVGFGPNGIRVNGALPQLRRASTLDLDTNFIDVNLDSNGVAATGTLPRLTRRDAVDLDAFTNQLVNAFGSDQNVGVYQNQDETNNGYGSDNTESKRGLNVNKRR